MPSIKLKPSDARDMVYDDHSDFEGVAGTEEIVDQSRWDTTRVKVVKHTLTGKFYEVVWSQGSTENQDYDEFEMAEKDIEYQEVSLQKVEVEKWLPVQ